ncbi:hypothetical protein B7R54_14255 [Subtercola boreus]|uniref:Uncharacterized protein n=1 Tax=Subtercola boreus TaxID=120213 RepID=A0A3E0VKI6_9MICO|nr:hypothetical protein [Subtercola boreus]RFA10241.1 hypothetical protein B7R54_14255 [Subtercola boreus]TQL52583.1 hypothetical protein FB464_0066 [Subtercola boreus]
MQSILTAKLFGDHVDPRVRLQQLFGGTLNESGCPPLPAVNWARAVFASADGGSDGRHRGSAALDPVTATGLLRTSEPRLTLRAAQFLAHHVTGYGAPLAA